MTSGPSLSSNFTHLQSHDEQLLRLGMLAERYFADDPNTCLLKLRQLSELLAQITASNVGVLDRPEDGQYELLLRLRDHGILPAEIYQLFGEVRRTGNAATPAMAMTFSPLISSTAPPRPEQAPAPARGRQLEMQSPPRAARTKRSQNTSPKPTRNSPTVSTPSNP